jgi:ELWxxDGT repeat protein
LRTRRGIISELLISWAAFFMLCNLGCGAAAPTVQSTRSKILNSKPVPHASGSNTDLPSTDLPTTEPSPSTSTDQNLSPDPQPSPSIGSSPSISDVTPPNVGTIGAATSLTDSGFQISWSAASDDYTPVANIEYLLCMSTTSVAINGIAGCESSAIGAYVTDDRSRSLVSLNPNTQYFVRVIAKDLAGNKSIYSESVVQTKVGYALSLMDATNLPSQTNFGMSLFSHQQRADLSNPLVANGYSYIWRREGTKERGWVLFKVPAVRNSVEVGQWLLKQCTGTSGTPTVLAVNQNVLFASADMTCDGVQDLVKVDLLTNQYVTIDKGFVALSTTAMFGDQLVFQGTIVAEGMEIWKSDGTVNGTTLLHPATAGASHTSLMSVASTPSYLLYSYVAGSSFGLGRWNGTGAPTSFAPAGLANSYNFIATGNKIVFSGENAAEGAELWVSDGTLGGTVLHKSFYSGTTGGNPQLASLDNGDVLVVGKSSATESSMITTNGTTITNYTSKLPAAFAFTKLVETEAFIYIDGFYSLTPKPFRFSISADTIEPLFSTSSTYFAIGSGWMCKVGEFVYFLDPALGLMRTTDMSQSEVADAGMLASSSFVWALLYPASSELSCGYLLALSGKLLHVNDNQSISTMPFGWGLDQPFSASDTTNYLLFNSTDGLSPHSGLRHNFSLGMDGSTHDIGDSNIYMARFGDSILHSNNNNQTKIYSLDLATNTSAIVKEMTDFSGLSYANALTTWGSNLYLSSNHGIYKTDGTTAGTVLVATTASGPTSFAINGSYLYMGAYTAANGYGLYRTTGAVGNLTRVVSTGTTVDYMVKFGTGVAYATSSSSTISYYNGSSNSNLYTDTLYGSSGVTTTAIRNLRMVGNVLLYEAASGASGFTTWRYRDPVSTNFYNVQNLYDASGLQFEITEAVELSGSIYVAAFHPTSGTGIWKFNLNFANPELVVELNNGIADAGIRDFELRGDRLVFVSDAGGDGFEPWLSDGTSVGTKQIGEIAAGAGSNPVILNRTTNGKIYVLGDSELGRAVYLMSLPE